MSRKIPEDLEKEDSKYNELLKEAEEENEEKLKQKKQKAPSVSAKKKSLVQKRIEAEDLLNKIEHHKQYQPKADFDISEFLQQTGKITC